MTPTPVRRRACALLSTLALLAACAGSSPFATPPDPDLAVATSAPRDRVALAQRSQQLRDAHESLGVFRATLTSLRSRSQERELHVFSQFLEAYLGLRVDPLLREDWQSQHPTLRAADASLRLAKADLLVRLRERSRADAVLDDVHERFAGSQALIVDYPDGKRQPLAQAVEMLRHKKWWAR